MIYLLGAILTNAILTIFFRWFSKYGVNNAPAIVVNYIVCFAVGLLFSTKSVLEFNPFSSEHFPWLAILSILFILGFNIAALTVQHFGVTIGTLMQKMSLIFVAIFAVIQYNESVSALKVVAILLGCISIFFITSKKKGAKKHIHDKVWYFALPFITLLISSIIDVLFLRLGIEKITIGIEAAFSSYLFLFAGIFGILELGYSFIFKNLQVNQKGYLLGHSIRNSQFLHHILYSKNATNRLGWLYPISY